MAPLLGHSPQGKMWWRADSVIQGLGLRTHRPGTRTQWGSLSRTFSSSGIFPGFPLPFSTSASWKDQAWATCLGPGKEDRPHGVRFSGTIRIQRESWLPRGFLPHKEKMSEPCTRRGTVMLRAGTLGALPPAFSPPALCGNSPPLTFLGLRSPPAGRTHILRCSQGTRAPQPAFLRLS